MATYKVGADGKAPAGLKPGDTVVTGGGTYTIGGVNANGSYTGATKTSDTNTYNYNGGYTTAPSAATVAQTQAQPSSGYVAKGTYSDADVTAADKAKLAALGAQYNAAVASGNTADAYSAHAAAEAIRSGYGYSGGNDGSQYLGAKQTNTVTPNTLPSATSQADYINSLYSASQDANLAALKTAYDNNTATVDAQAAKIPGVYHEAENQVAANNAQQTQKMNEYFAANGLNTGASGQAQLAQNTTAQKSIGTLENAKATALNDVETQRTTLATQYQNAIAEAIANNNYEKAKSLYDEAVRVDNSIVSTAINQAQLNYQAATDSYNRTAAQAETLGQYGNFSGYSALGYTPSQTNSMSAAYQTAIAAKAAKSSGSGSGGGGGGYGGGTSGFSAVDAYANSGGDSDDFLTLNYKAMGYSTAAQAKAAYAVYQQGNTAATTKAEGQAGMYSNLLLLVKDANRRAQKLSDGSYLVPTRIAQAVKGGGITEAQGADLLAQYSAYGGK